MFRTTALSIAVTLIALIHDFPAVLGFVIPHKKTTSIGAIQQQQPPSLQFQERGRVSVSLSDGYFPDEFTVVDDDNNDDKDGKEKKEDATVDEINPSSKKEESERKVFEYAAMLPGTSVDICVGDIGLARKAWKKRRRSGSPLLVPCSVLNVDRKNMIRWNILYLLEKFGHDQKDGIAISLSELSIQHRKHLRSSLTQHGMALGHESPRELVESLFPRKEQNTYGVRLWTTATTISKNDGSQEEYENEQLWMKAPISRFRAQKKAEKAAILQVHVDEENDNNDDNPEEGNHNSMKHTGRVRIKKSNKERPILQDGTVVEEEQQHQKRSYYQFPPLSAALRVSQRDDLDTGRITNGSMLSAVIFDYDRLGDGGSPLLTLSLNPSRAADHHKHNVRNSRALKIANTNNKAGIYNKYQPIKHPKGMLDDIQMGDGPFTGKIVRLFGDRALVDCQIGRAPTKQQQSDIGIPDMVKVFGSLQFKDAEPVSSSRDERQQQQLSQTKSSLPPMGFAKEENKQDVNDKTDDYDIDKIMEDVFEKIADEGREEGEEEEDISHLFNIDDDGFLSYQDPESGDTTFILADEDDNKQEEEKDLVSSSSPRNAKSDNRRQTTKKLYIGDHVDVYIKSVSKQSNQYSLTMNPSQVQGKKPKVFKKEMETNKKLERLEKMIPGGLQRIEELAGTEYLGTIKATSQTGDWFYVQPNNKDSDDDSKEQFQLPVGVATIDDEDEITSEEIVKGDIVRIQLRGIDEHRGQLSMRVIEKITP